MKTTYSSNLKIVALIAATCFAALSIGNSPALGQTLPSDELLIQTPPGTVPPSIFFDAKIPETGATAPEAEAIFSPVVMPPPAIPVPLPPGSTAVILTEPAGEPPELGEVPIFFTTPNGRVQVSDVIIATNSQTFPSIIALISDGDPLLGALVPTLPPTTPFMPEFGVLQDVTGPLLGSTGIFPPVGPVQVLVSSDVTTPEPSSVVLIVLGLVSVAAYKWRKNGR
jgi:hypothetical protein